MTSGANAGMLITCATKWRTFVAIAVVFMVVGFIMLLAGAILIAKHEGYILQDDDECTNGTTGNSTESSTTPSAATATALTPDVETTGSDTATTPASAGTTVATTTEQSVQGINPFHKNELDKELAGYEALTAVGVFLFILGIIILCITLTMKKKKEEMFPSLTTVATA